MTSSLPMTTLGAGGPALQGVPFVLPPSRQPLCIRVACEAEDCGALLEVSRAAGCPARLRVAQEGGLALDCWSSARDLLLPANFSPGGCASVCERG